MVSDMDPIPLDLYHRTHGGRQKNYLFDFPSPLTPPPAWPGPQPILVTKKSHK